MKNFSGTVGTGGLNGQGLDGAYTQVITNNKPLYSYYLYDFKGYDASGNSIYTNAAGQPAGLGDASKQLLNKQPLPKINYGFSSTFKYKGFDAVVRSTELQEIIFMIIHKMPISLKVPF